MRSDWKRQTINIQIVRHIEPQGFILPPSSHQLQGLYVDEVCLPHTGYQPVQDYPMKSLLSCQEKIKNLFLAN